MNNKTGILFLCTGNSCRSQMAEGLCRYLFADTFDVYSAGIEKHGLNPLAVKAMAEIGIDISQHHSKTLAELDKSEFDYVITVCGQADEACPLFPANIKVLHHGFDDPPKLALNALNEDQAMGHYRRVRDEIKEFVKGLPEVLAR